MRMKVITKGTQMPGCNMVGGLGPIPVWVKKSEIKEGGHGCGT